MSGPPYPRVVPGTNFIGKDAIGIGPIGSIPPLDVWTTIISQYANSLILTTLILNIFQYLDQTANFDAFFDFVMNVDTAQGYGLDVWGRIVGVSRVIQVPVAQPWFGFKESTGSSTFGQAGFSTGQTITNNFYLSDTAFRLLILAKAAANITDGSIPSINAILMSLFPGRGNCYVSDGSQLGTYFGFQESINGQGFGQASFYNGASLFTMSMQYVFTFPLSPVEIAIVSQSGALPKPVGVSASVVII